MGIGKMDCVGRVWEIWRVVCLLLVWEDGGVRAVGL